METGFDSPMSINVQKVPYIIILLEIKWFMLVKLAKLEKQKSKLILLKINIAIPHYQTLWFRDKIFAFQIFCY